MIFERPVDVRHSVPFVDLANSCVARFGDLTGLRLVGAEITPAGERAAFPIRAQPIDEPRAGAILAVGRQAAVADHLLVLQRGQKEPVVRLLEATAETGEATDKIRAGGDLLPDAIVDLKQVACRIIHTTSIPTLDTRACAGLSRYRHWFLGRGFWVSEFETQNPRLKTRYRLRRRLANGRSLTLRAFAREDAVDEVLG